jgi:hypothetical protein
VILRVWVAVTAAALVAVITYSVDDEVVVGVPEIVPVDAFIVRPLGSAGELE